MADDEHDDDDGLTLTLTLLTARLRRCLSICLSAASHCCQKTLLDARVEYINAYASLLDAHTVIYTDDKGASQVATADKIIVAVGGRPKYPSDVEGAQLGISSDDIFWQSKAPGKTLCVGASYISLECAGFLHELGFDTSVMVRSILLRGFDTQAAIQIGEHMERSGLRFIGHAVPVKLERLAGPDGRITVTFQQHAFVDGSGAAVPAAVHQEEFDTVLFATGREALIREIGLDKAGVRTEQGKIVVDSAERTSVENIFAIGDVILNRPELTPVAIKAGQMLAKRLFGGAAALMDYDFVSQQLPAQETQRVGSTHCATPLRFALMRSVAVCLSLPALFRFRRLCSLRLSTAPWA